MRLAEIEKNALRQALAGFRGEVYLFGSRLDLVLYQDTRFHREIRKNARRIDPSAIH